MNVRDRIGSRGESIFRVLITRRCDKKDWFEEKFLGEKGETIDFLVNLVDAPSGHAIFYVQVKATSLGYYGKGRNRKLKVSLAKEDLQKLLSTHSPTYVVGIDIDKECGFVLPITSSLKRGFSRLSTKRRLDCKTIKAIWREVNEYWKNKPTAMTSSSIS